MLAAITCYFNPIEYGNILRNYWMFREDLKDVDLFTIELSFNGNFEIDDAIHVEGTPQHIMWQKERLLNLLLEQLPPQYDKVAWLDADILFDNPNWAKQTEKRLDKWPMAQLFENVLETNIDLEPVAKTPGIVAKPEAREIRSGFAWAARREVLEQVSLLDTFVMGGADRMIFHAAKGFFNNYYLTRTNIEWRRSYLKWAAKFYQQIEGHLGLVGGDITHLYHGTYADRNHAERWMVLSQQGFNPEKDLCINKNGIWEWTVGRSGLRQVVTDYFKDRQDDEVWIAKMRNIVGETSPGQKSIPEKSPSPS